MTEAQKTKKVETIVGKLKRIADDSIKKENYRKALDAITAASFILEEYNQYYVDEKLEGFVKDIAKKLVVPAYGREEGDPSTILFYDSFGFDVRALALVYMHALADLGYRVIYITKAESKDSQPEPRLNRRTASPSFTKPLSTAMSSGIMYLTITVSRKSVT